MREQIQYTMFHEYNPRAGRDRKLLRPGHRIRVDVPVGQFHKIKLLHRCRNWRINPELGHAQNGIRTYYIDVLS